MNRRTRRYNGYTPGEILTRSAAAVAILGGFALVAASIDSDPTTSEYGFAVECADPAAKPNVIYVSQQDVQAYTQEQDSIAVGCGPEGNAPTSVDLVDQPDNADVTFTVQYHNGIFDSGAPIVSVKPGGFIDLIGNGTIANWEVTAEESN